MTNSDFDALFRPRVIAVAGMSANKKNAANRFASGLREFGYQGALYAVHPTANEIDGVRAYPTFEAIPQHVDYAYIASPARTLPDLLRGAKGRVSFAQVLSSGFGETGNADDARLQNEMMEAAINSGVRVIGPNCIGTYSPRGGLTFTGGVSPIQGGVGVVSQSGGLAVDFIRRGMHRGVRFSGVVSVGNAVDVDPPELLDYFLRDPDTKVIGFYLESCRRGRELFNLLKSAAGRKPVVLLKGGRSEQGSRAAASHTGALVSNDRIWNALCAQTGVVLTDNLDQFIDALAVLQHFDMGAGHVTKNVALVGNGGGTSVLATDAFSRAGLSIAPLSAETKHELECLKLPPGTSVVNPVDTPATTMVVDNGRVIEGILDITARDMTTDTLVVHVNIAVLLGFTDDPSMLMDNIGAGVRSAARNLPRGKRLVAVLRSDGDPDVDLLRRHLTASLAAEGVAVLHELHHAAEILGRIGHAESVVNVTVAQRENAASKMSAAAG